MLFRLFWTFLQIGAFSFGGGYAMLPLIEKFVIDQNHWISPDVFVDVIAISQITPGPIAINAATFIGYRISGVFGAAVSTLGVVAVPVTLILILSRLVHEFKESEWVEAIFSGLRPALVGLILASAFSVGKTALMDLKGVAVAVGVFLLVNFTKLHPILVIALAAVSGWVLYG